MKLLVVTKLERSARAIDTVIHYFEAGKALGHEVTLFGEQLAEFPRVPTSLAVADHDFALFIIHDTRDFPELPHLARVLDGMPKKRRVLIDCCGRFNETIRIDHDFNHLEKIDGQQGWEWVEGIKAISDKILQPCTQPRRADVRSFLFHGFDPSSVARPYRTAAEAAASWRGQHGNSKPYGLMYVGNNWQRWSQVQPLLETIEPIAETMGPSCFAGADWASRPDWAVNLGIQGVDVRTELLQRLRVETRWPIPFNEVVDLQSQARFSPVIQRPTFNHLGLLTNRAFATFYADTVPLLLLPEELVRTIHGPQAAPLLPGESLRNRIEDVLRRPEYYWDAVLETRHHLARHHSYAKRFQELIEILES
jgi:hypothetical protein